MSEKSDTPTGEMARLIDEVASLTRELAEARAERNAAIARSMSNAMEAQAHEDRARMAEVECERLREDAERYRWLRVNPSKWNWFSAASVFGWKTPDQIDAAIDAARKP